MRIDELMPHYDASERHERLYDASPAEVWDALSKADLAGSPVVRLLMGIRTLPQRLFGRSGEPRPRGRVDLAALERAGFGVLAQEPGREIVLGIEGRFWRPTGNVRGFERARFDRPVEAGLARGVWNFRVEPAGDGRARLVTETRILCGDAASRRKFRLYWTFVRPGSGAIRHAMLAAVARELRRRP